MQFCESLGWKGDHDCLLLGSTAQEAAKEARHVIGGRGSRVSGGCALRLRRRFGYCGDSGRERRGVTLRLRCGVPCMRVCHGRLLTRAAMVLSCGGGALSGPASDGAPPSGLGFGGAPSGPWSMAGPNWTISMRQAPLRRMAMTSGMQSSCASRLRWNSAEAYTARKTKDTWR